MKFIVEQTRNRVERAKTFYGRNEHLLDASMFVAGFIFDIVTLSSIDDIFTLVQQLVYLLLLGSLIAYEVQIEVLKKNLHPKLNKIWPYRGLIIHFFLGSLLNTYILFFFKSGSFISSFLFIFIVVALILLNELPFIRNLGAYIRVILFSLCLSSFWSIVFPLVIGFIHWLLFVLALLMSALISICIYKILNRTPSPVIENLSPKNPLHRLSVLQRHYLLPSLGTYSFFFLFYIFGLVPPVPLSIQYMGVYHKIEKKADKYELYYTRPRWKFWQNGDQSFEAQPGDKIYFFASIFAPTQFRDQIFLKWYYDDPKNGWQTWDSIPLTISGGRQEGFRGFGTKQNYTPGNWQVRVLTNDQREIGRLSFTIEAVPASDTTLYFIDYY